MSSACVCHTNESFCFYCEVYKPEVQDLVINLAVANSTIVRIQKIFTDACTKINCLESENTILKEALNHIAERNFIPPSMAADVALDALLRSSNAC